MERAKSRKKGQARHTRISHFFSAGQLAFKLVSTACSSLLEYTSTYSFAVTNLQVLNKSGILLIPTGGKEEQAVGQAIHVCELLTH